MHKSIILFAILVSFFVKTNAQYSGASFEIHYPLIFSDNYNEYIETDGVLGGSLQYQFTENIPFNFGIEYKFDLIKAVDNPSDYSTPKNINYLISNINLFSKMMLITVPELQIYLTGGFSQYKYRGSDITPSYLGFNLGGGLTYDIYDKIYVFSTYSFLKTSLKSHDGDYKYTEKNQLVRMGLGFKF